MSSFIDTIVFDASGHTGNEYYVRFVVDDTGYIYDEVAEALVAPAAAVWANTAIALDEQGLTGQFPVVVPDELPTGKRYNVVIYLQAGSDPANTDDIEKQYQTMLGSIFGF